MGCAGRIRIDLARHHRAVATRKKPDFPYAEGDQAMSAIERYHQATVRAEQKKVQFLSSVSAAKERVKPGRLKQDIKEKAANGIHNGRLYLTDKVRQQPVAVGATAAALLIYLFRRPISALLKKTYVRITNRNPELAETDDG